MLSIPGDLYELLFLLLVRCLYLVFSRSRLDRSVESVGFMLRMAARSLTFCCLHSASNHRLAVKVPCVGCFYIFLESTIFEDIL